MGYRADNSYFSFAEDFLNNAISLNHLNSAMRLGELGSQYVLVSQKGFNAIRFDQAKQVDNAAYFPRFINRDLMSKIGYRNNAVNLPFDPSDYYCLEYVVPIDKVIIDGQDRFMTAYRKTMVLLEAALLRLYKYWLNDEPSFDHDNVILRLGDYDTMQEEYFVKAEKMG